MAYKVILPKIGLSEESSIIGEWYKKKGDQVKKRDPLFTVETDKSSVEIEAQEEGTILEIFYNEGDEAPVLSTVCILGNPGEDISELLAKNNDREAMKDDDIVKPSNISEQIISKDKEPSIKHETNLEEKSHKKISPRARNLAQDAKIDFREAEATGPKGRIIERDITTLIQEKKMFTTAAYQKNAQSDGHYIVQGTGIGGRTTLEDLSRIKEKEGLLTEKPQVKRVEKLKSIRKTIAVNMMKSLQSSAQLTLNASFDASDILDYRKKLKLSENSLLLNKITVNDFVIYAVSRTLINHPYLNAHLVEDEVRFFENVHIGVAVDTPKGLMVPTIPYAESKSLNDISIQVKELAQKCNGGTIIPEELKGGSFTISNLGNMDIEHFTPVLNPPQTGILGVGSLVYRMKEKDDEIVPYPAIGLSLTFDHRALDGAPAARFLKELKNNLENFTILLAK